MKKILFALAILTGLHAANAQVTSAPQTKSPEDAKKALNSAIEASKDAKKAVKAATWIKLGKAYLDAYDAPTATVAGSTKQEVSMLMTKEQPSSSEQVIINEQAYIKDSYEDKVLWYNYYDERLVGVQVTKPVVENALEGAVEAYSKAYELDNKKAEDISAALNGIVGRYLSEAVLQYTLGDYALSSQLFVKTATTAAVAPLSQLDTNSYYNAGLTAMLAKDNAKSKEYLDICYNVKYYGESGAVFSNLAQVDPDNAKAYLEEGFTLYPESQSILIGLINYYMSHNESTDKLFELIGQAKANDPTNASLTYVEGNIYAQLGQTDKAIECYRACATVNPNYEFGYIGEGQLFYNRAVEIQEAAQAELDDDKYMALVSEFETTLKSCIEPFEKAYEVTKDDAIKLAVAEYIKNAAYRFRDEDDKYQKMYDKYSAVVANQ